MKEQNEIYADALREALHQIEANLPPGADLEANLRSQAIFLSDVADLIATIRENRGPQAGDPITPFPGQVVYRPVFSPLLVPHNPEWVDRLGKVGEIPKPGAKNTQ